MNIEMCTFPKKTQDYNWGVSGSSETDLTDKENNTLWSGLYGSFFHGLTTSSHTQNYEKKVCKKAQ